MIPQRDGGSNHGQQPGRVVRLVIGVQGRAVSCLVPDSGLSHHKDTSQTIPNSKLESPSALGPCFRAWWGELSDPWEASAALGAPPGRLPHFMLTEGSEGTLCGSGRWGSPDGGPPGWRLDAGSGSCWQCGLGRIIWVFWLGISFAQHALLVQEDGGRKNVQGGRAGASARSAHVLRLLSSALR